MNSPLDNVINRLENVKRRGKEWDARCPAHDDNKNSLGVSVGKEGRILLCCQAGCKTETIVDRLGLKMSDLFTEADKNPAKSSLSAAYDYTDEAGKALFQCVRFEPKDFRQRRPDGNGGWLWNLKDTRRVLYRLPEVRAAIEKGETVFIVEGEKDADNLARLGLCATCNPMGAGKWSAEYSEQLRGANAVVLPDNDEPGRIHAAQVGAALLQTAARILTLTLPNLPPKGDVSDWIAAGGTKEQLLTLAESAPQADANAAQTTGPEWEEIVSFGSATLPPFPITDLPDWLYRFVEMEAERTQTPPDLAGTLVLTALAAACAGTHEVVIPNGYREPLNLYGVIALPPGSRKTAVFEAVMKPIKEFEKAETAAQMPEIEAAKTSYEILKARLEKAKKEAANGKDAMARLESESDAKALTQELISFPVPSIPRRFADDVTPEKLAGLLAEQGGRMALLSAEGGTFDIIAGRYSDAPNFDVYLKGHAGDTLRVDRQNRPPEFIDRPTLTMGLAVQPDVLQGLAAKPGFRGRGLLGRFLYSLPASNIGGRVVDFAPLSPEAVAAGYEYNSRMMNLLTLAPAQDSDENPVPHSLHLTPAALELLTRWGKKVEKELSDGGELHSLPDWGGKLVGATLRMAGGLHLASGEAGNISDITLGRAIRLAQYFTVHARAVFDMMGADAEIEGARRILDWIRRTRCEKFTKRDAHQALRSRFLKAAELDAPLALLVERSYICEETPERKGDSGRNPGKAFVVNPATQNTQNTQN